MPTRIMIRDTFERCLQDWIVVSEFGWLEGGEYDEQTLYDEVKRYFPSYCNDAVVCRCRGRGDRPEWQHQVSKALQTLENRGLVSHSGNTWELAVRRRDCQA